MYSFHPIDNTSNLPTAIILTALCLVIAFLCFVIVIELCKMRFVKLGWSAVGSLFLLGAYSTITWYIETPVEVYKNEPFTGEFRGFVAEGYTTSERSGKQTSRKEHSLQYVVYSVNGDQVLLAASTAVSYPQRVVLYKN